MLVGRRSSSGTTPAVPAAVPALAVGGISPRPNVPTSRPVRTRRQQHAGSVRSVPDRCGRGRGLHGPHDVQPTVSAVRTGRMTDEHVSDEALDTRLVKDAVPRLGERVRRQHGAGRRSHRRRAGPDLAGPDLVPGRPGHLRAPDGLRQASSRRSSSHRSRTRPASPASQPNLSSSSSAATKGCRHEREPSR